MQTHKEWLDNEYQQWAEALNQSTVHNFKEHPMVRRMLGEPDDVWKSCVTPADNEIANLFKKIEKIGGDNIVSYSNACLRMIHYASIVMYLNPSSICEIGGGVGQFYAILRALGYKGKYYIYDLPDVRAFQDKYLAEVSNQTGLQLPLEESGKGCDLLVSFYALGEFDDEKKQWYKHIIDAAPHGYIAWNPHSGANDDLSIFDNKNINVTPGVEPEIKIITW